MNRSQKLAIALAVTVGLMVGGTVAAGASTPRQTGSASTSSQGALASHCDVLIGRADAKTHVSALISRSCRTETVAAAKAQSVSPFSSGTLLLTIYQDINYGFHAVTISGNDGPCDASGYGIRDMTQLGNFLISGSFSAYVLAGMSSYKTWNNCGKTELFTSSAYGGTASGFRYGDQPYVGTTFNDNTDSMPMRAIS